MRELPKNFLWGGALSACQAEGAWDVDGKALTFPEVVKRIDPSDRKSFFQAKITPDDIKIAKTAPISDYPKRWGIDFYHTYREDIALFKEMGFTCLRYSIPLARIFPDLLTSKPNEKALAHYDDMVNEVYRQGMASLVTLSHFDPPVAVYEQFGGWCNEEMIDVFYRFAQVLIDRYHDKIKFWLPFNEINAGITAPFKGVGIPYTDDAHYTERCWQAVHNQFVCSAMITKYTHDHYPDLEVGCMIAHQTRYPYSAKPEDVLATDLYYQMHNYIFLDVLTKGEYPYYAKEYFAKHSFHVDMHHMDLLKDGCADWVGLSYYQSSLTAWNEEDKDHITGNMGRGLRNEYLQANEWGWQIDPIGLRITLNRLYDRYHKPLFVLENGLGFVERLEENNCIHDSYRIEYLREHLKALMEAVNDGCEVCCYTWWSPIDLISSGTSEMSKRYGFIYVDQNEDGSGSKKRYKKDSFFFYQKVINSNGKELY